MSTTRILRETIAAIEQHNAELAPGDNCGFTFGTTLADLKAQLKHEEEYAAWRTAND